jgi:signal transduction histidine kinase
VPGGQNTARVVLDADAWHHAIEAVLAEDRTGLVPTARSATDIVVERTKTIAHEVRNALVPVRHHLDALRGVIAAPQARRVDAAKRGVVRVLTFVDEMVATSELMAEATASCDVAGMIREAVGWIDGDERISVQESAIAVRVLAPRSQLTHAIANVLRNALQATTDLDPVRVSAVRSSGVVRITIDDGGRGVPADARERVFHEGYTTRSDGSGYGLAYARRVIADVLRGRVWCEDSDLGGARFVIELPEIESEP